MPEYTITEGFVDSHEKGKRYPGYIEAIENTENDWGPGECWYFVLDGEDEPVRAYITKKTGEGSHLYNFISGLNRGVPPLKGDEGNTDKYIGHRVAVIYGDKKMGKEGIRINYIIKLDDKPDLTPSQQPVRAAREQLNADEAPF